MPTPWHDDDFVYFELSTPEFVAFDLHSEGVVCPVADFEPGSYRLPIDAIRPATAQDRQAGDARFVSVDACQIFLVDRAFVTRFRDLLDADQGGWPNYPYFDRLRREVGTDFGLALVTSDGEYVVDPSAVERVPRGKAAARKRPGAGSDDPYLKVARRMRTFVCEVCFKEELMQPDDADAKELARLARAGGWLLPPPPAGREGGFFEAFQVVGPSCAGQASRGAG